MYFAPSAYRGGIRLGGPFERRHRRDHRRRHPDLRQPELPDSAGGGPPRCGHSGGSSARCSPPAWSPQLIAYPVYELTSQLAPWPFPPGGEPHRHAGGSRRPRRGSAGISASPRSVRLGIRPALAQVHDGSPVVSGIVGMATAAARRGGAAGRCTGGSPAGAQLPAQAPARRLEFGHRRRTHRRDRDARRHALPRSHGSPVPGPRCSSPRRCSRSCIFSPRRASRSSELHWASGFDLIARSFAPLGTPALVLDSFTGVACGEPGA